MINKKEAINKEEWYRYNRKYILDYLNAIVHNYIPYWLKEVFTKQKIKGYRMLAIKQLWCHVRGIPYCLIQLIKNKKSF